MKKRIADLIMIILLVVLAVTGILYAGNLKGWFDKKNESVWTIGDIRGVITLKREGVSYTPDNATNLRKGDIIICKDSASAVLRSENADVYVNGGSELEIKDVSDKDLSVKVIKGEVFADSQRPLILVFDSISTDVGGSVVSLSVRSGALTLNVFSGKTEEAKSSERAEWIDGSKSVGKISIDTLNEFNIECLKKVLKSKKLCFTKAELDAVTEKRKEEISTDLDSETQCSITIVCDTILDNTDELDPTKAEFVPDDGIILPFTSVDIEEGDSVFDILNRVCEENDIQIEYSWTPMYDSYYIEGINNLYEYDCGYESGWMYKVNGWFPNYGCSDYSVKPGDNIVWCYTCKGLGDDVGDTSF